MGFMANHNHLQLQLTPIKVIMHHTFPAHPGSTLWSIFSLSLSTIYSHVVGRNSLTFLQTINTTMGSPFSKPEQVTEKAPLSKMEVAITSQNVEHEYTEYRSF